MILDSLNPYSSSLLLPSHAESNSIAKSSRMYLFGLQLVDFSLSGWVCFFCRTCLFKIILVTTAALPCNHFWSYEKGPDFSTRVSLVLFYFIFHFTFINRICWHYINHKTMSTRSTSITYPFKTASYIIQYFYTIHAPVIYKYPILHSKLFGFRTVWQFWNGKLTSMQGKHILLYACT